MSGGLCSRPDPQLVPANKFVQLDNAILADHDILEKAPGYIVDGSPFPASPDSWIRMNVNYRVGASTNSIIVAAQDNGNTNSSYKVDFKQTFGNGTYNYIGYTTGTALFTSGSADVVGVGTAWSTNLKAGDKIGTGVLPTAWYEILTITNDTNLVLTTTYTGTTTVTTSYMARIILNLGFIPFGLQFNQKLVETNGSEVPMEFDNTTWTLLNAWPTAFSGFPLPTMMEKHKNRLFFADPTSNLTWSHDQDETLYEGDSEAPVFPEDGGNTVAIKSFANSLMVFKDNGLIYQVYGEFNQDVVGAPTNIRLIDVPDNIGIIAGRTVVKNDDGKLYFMAETGFYTINMYMQVVKVSWDIQPDIQNLIFAATVQANKQFVFASAAQWHTGTLSGTTVNGNNQLTLYCDQMSMSGYSQGNNFLSCAVDGNNNIHAIGQTPYPTSMQNLNYTQFKADGTQINEIIFQIDGGQLGPGGGTAYNAADVMRSCAIACSSNGNAGVAYSWSMKTPTSSIQGIMYTERVTQGTATFTLGSRSVAGSGTAWLSGPCPLTAGSLIKSAIDNQFYAVSTVNSDISITLTANYSGTTQTGQNYVSWSTPTAVVLLTYPIVQFEANPSLISSLSIKFNVTDPSILWAYSDGSFNSSGIFMYSGSASYYSRVGQSFGLGVAITTGQSQSFICRASLDIFSPTIAAASFTFDNTTIYCYTTSTGGGAWSLAEAFATSLIPQDTIQISIDGGGDPITGFASGGNIFKRNHVTLVTTELDSSSNCQFNGYVFSDGNDYAMDIVGAAPLQFEKYIFLSSDSVESSNSDILLSGIRTNQGFDNNGAVFGGVAFGVGTGTIFIRRVSFKGTWTSAVTSDSTLTSWGNYAVSGEVDSGATVLQQLALGTTSSVGTPFTVTNGQLISTDDSDVFFQATVTMTLGQLVAPVIGSIVLNYVGAGVTATIPFGIIFNNEMYVSSTQTGGTQNNFVLFLDRKGAWGDTFPPVTSFARMNQLLYAGSSLQGDVYKLKTGYNFNGSAYSLTAITKEDMLGSVELPKDISKAYVLYRVQPSGTFTFSYRIDSYKTVGGSAWFDTIIDQTIIDPSIGGIEIPIQQVGNSIQFKISQNDANVKVQFIGFVLMYGYLNVR